jgi:Ni,Fe-hydrogenase III large subunit
VPARGFHSKRSSPHASPRNPTPNAANTPQVPLRVRTRSSSFCNLSVTNDICRNCLIADVPAIVGSIDIVMGEIDR